MTTVVSSSTTELIKDQNVPNELSFHQVCDDPNSQRYVCQLKMGRRSTLKSHYLDDQESDEQLAGNHIYNNIAKPTPSENLYPTSLINKPNVDDIIKPVLTTATTAVSKIAFDSKTTYYQNGNAVKRGCEDVEYENEDDSNASSSSSSGTSASVTRRSPPKKPKFVVTYKEMREFFNLLNEESIRQFLIRDSCCLISDKYALAMVFTYFKRAKFHLNEYTRINFYLALYLASDIEEDIDEYKYEIFPWALGSRWRSKFTGFLKKRDALLRRIGYRAIVSRKCCEEVMSLAPEHYAWKRERSEDHGGATRAYTINKCRRMHSEANRLSDEVELSLPRGPYENPRPCSICLVKQYTTKKTPINEFMPTMSSYHHARLSSVASTISNSTISTSAAYESNNNDSKLSDRSKLVNQEEDDEHDNNQELIRKQTLKQTTKSILKPSQSTNIYSNQKQQQISKYSHKTENDENNNVDVNNNNSNNCAAIKNNGSKINNLVLNENIFMYKNTCSYQNILSGCDSSSNNNKQYQDYLDSTDEDENEDKLTNDEVDKEEEEQEDDDDDDETDDCNDDDEVFANPIHLKNHHSYYNTSNNHHQQIKNKHNSIALNSRKTYHPKKWSSNAIASSSTISREITKKRPTCSLSASANLLIANSVKANSNSNGNGEMLSTSYPKQINDQLVPREILIKK